MSKSKAQYVIEATDILNEVVNNFPDDSLLPEQEKKLKALKCDKERLESEISLWVQWGNAVEKAIQGNRLQSTALSQKQRDLETALKAIPTPVDMAPIQSRLAEIETNIKDYVLVSVEEIEAKLRTLSQEVSKMEMDMMVNNQYHDLKKTVDTLQKQQEAAQAVEYAINRAQGDTLTRQQDNILYTANMFLEAAIGDGAKVFIDTDGAKECDFGWIRDGKKVSVGVLSGGEYVLFSTAMLLSLLNFYSPQCPILLIEGGECDPQSAQKLMNGLVEAKKHLPNLPFEAIVTHHSPIPGWAEITFGQGYN